jgi:hypothetical protein
LSGQGTQAIKVLVPGRGLTTTATLHVEGLPVGCVNSVSENATDIIDPGPIKLGEITEPLSHVRDERFIEIANIIVRNPYGQLYVFAPADVSVRTAVIDRISKAIPGHAIDISQMTFVESGSKSPFLQFWLVPPGATPPSKCEGCEPLATPTAATPAPANCPTLEVTGPSGVTARGAIMPFVVLVSEPRLKNLSFAWTISMGTIAEGQGTRVIKVRAPAANGTKNIVATVTVQGLPQGCRNVASDTAEIAFTGGRVVRDVYAFGQ